MLAAKIYIEYLKHVSELEQAEIFQVSEDSNLNFDYNNNKRQDYELQDHFESELEFSHRESKPIDNHQDSLLPIPK